MFSLKIKISAAAESLGYDLKKLPQFISHARNILPSNVPIQVPPNLVCKNQTFSVKRENFSENIFHRNISMKESKSQFTDFNRNETENENKNENDMENESTYLLSLITSGASDLGGISPHDEVNPTYRFQKIENIKSHLQSSGYDLIERLPVYEHHFPNLSERVKKVIDMNYENFYK